MLHRLIIVDSASSSMHSLINNIASLTLLTTQTATGETATNPTATNQTVTTQTERNQTRPSRSSRYPRYGPVSINAPLRSPPPSQIHPSTSSQPNTSSLHQSHLQALLTTNNIVRNEVTRLRAFILQQLPSDLHIEQMHLEPYPVEGTGDPPNNNIPNETINLITPYDSPTSTSSPPPITTNQSATSASPDQTTTNRPRLSRRLSVPPPPALPPPFEQSDRFPDRSPSPVLTATFANGQFTVRGILSRPVAFARPPPLNVD